LTLLGAVLGSADTFAARLRFGRFIGMVSSEENTYFLRAFEALGVTEDRRAADPDTQPTAGFKAIMREAAETHSYAAALSVLVGGLVSDHRCGRSVREYDTSGRCTDLGDLLAFCRCSLGLDIMSRRARIMIDVADGPLRRNKSTSLAHRSSIAGPDNPYPPLDHTSTAFSGGAKARNKAPLPIVSPQDRATEAGKPDGRSNNSRP
jgi:hypothetical protein